MPPKYNRSRYPFMSDLLLEGGSFFVPNRRPVALAAARKTAGKKSDRRFELRPENGGTRVYRIADFAAA